MQKLFLVMKYTKALERLESTEHWLLIFFFFNKRNSDTIYYHK